MVNQDEQRSEMETKDNSAKHPIELVAISEDWLNQFNDQMDALRCLGRAEAAAEHYTDNSAERVVSWVAIARSWKQMFGAIHQSVRCMEKATVAANSVAEKIFVAEKWATELNEWERSIQQMFEAESAVDSALDHLYLAQIWEQLFNDNTTAREYMQKAGDINQHKPFDNTSDWLSLGYWWMNIGVHTEARRCARYAGIYAKNSLDWEKTADIWEKLEYEPMVRYCKNKVENIKRESEKPPWDEDDDLPF